jgi:hypothetical protein
MPETTYFIEFLNQWLPLNESEAKAIEAVMKLRNYKKKSFLL